MTSLVSVVVYADGWQLIWEEAGRPERGLSKTRGFWLLLNAADSLNPI